LRKTGGAEAKRVFSLKMLFAVAPLACDEMIQLAQSDRFTVIPSRMCLPTGPSYCNLVLYLLKKAVQMESSNMHVMPSLTLGCG